MKSGILNFLEPSGLLQACNGTALSFLLCILEAQWRYHIIDKHDVADTLFEILEGWGNLKCIGLELRNKNCRIKKLRGN
jgi:hypothetical protein